MSRLVQNLLNPQVTTHLQTAVSPGLYLPRSCWSAEPMQGISNFWFYKTCFEHDEFSNVGALSTYHTRTLIRGRGFQTTIPIRMISNHNKTRSPLIELGTASLVRSQGYGDVLRHISESTQIMEEMQPCATQSISDLFRMYSSQFLQGIVPAQEQNQPCS